MIVRHIFEISDDSRMRITTKTVVRRSSFVHDMEDDFAFRYVRIYPGVNSRAELVTLAPGLRPERRLARRWLGDYPHHQTKKVENTSTLYHRIIGSNWNRKLVPKAHSRGQFCSDPVLSHAYFPEWKPALR